MNPVLAFLGQLFNQHSQGQPQAAAPQKKSLEDFGWTKGADGVYRQGDQQPVQQPMLQQQAQAMPSSPPQQMNGATLENSIRQVMKQRGSPLGDQDISLLAQAGLQFQSAGLDPLMPAILAVRETQGGKDNADPNKNKKLGKNNIYNIRGTQGGQTQFVNYPDLKTATFGGQNGGDQSQGLAGLVLKNDIYGDYRKSKNLEDFFSHWSPTQDNNGAMPEQVQNYNWIRNTFPAYQ